MEAWLAELEMEMDSSSTLMDNPNQTMEAYFDKQLAAALGGDFPYPLSAESNNTSSQWDFDCNIIEHFTSTPNIFNDNGNQDVIVNNDNNNNDNDNDNYNDNNIDNISSNNTMNVQERQRCKSKEETKKKQGVNGGTKRKRQPSQVQDHILAERKRRELLSQMFISLSAIVPGLKKVDKTSVLGEAIKYMKQLQEKVKVLEENVAKRTVESVVVVKKSHLTMDNDDDDSSSAIDDSCASGNSGLNPNNSNNNGGNNSDPNNYIGSLQEIEVKASAKTLLLRVCCEDEKGILAKLFAELDKYDISVTNCNVVPFDNLALDITIVAQIKERGFNNNVKDIVRSLRSVLRLSSHQCHASSPDDRTP